MHQCQLSDQSSLDPLITVVPSLLKQVLNFIPISPSSFPFSSLSLLNIDHGTPIPSYFNDNHLLIHLAFILYPQLGDDALEKIARDYMDIENVEAAGSEAFAETETVAADAEEPEEESDIQILDSPHLCS